MKKLIQGFTEVFTNIFIYLFTWFIYLFIYLVLAVASEIFSCDTWTLSCSLWGLAPQPGMESWSPTLGVWDLHHCCCLIIKLCPTLCDPVDCSPLGSSLCPWDFPGKNTGPLAIGPHLLSFSGGFHLWVHIRNTWTLVFLIHTCRESVYSQFQWSLR